MREVIAGVGLVRDLWRMPLTSEVPDELFRYGHGSRSTPAATRSALRRLWRSGESGLDERCGRDSRVTRPAAMERLNCPTGTVRLDQAGAHAACDGDRVCDVLGVEAEQLGACRRARDRTDDGGRVEPVLEHHGVAPGRVVLRQCDPNVRLVRRYERGDGIATIRTARLSLRQDRRNEGCTGMRDRG